MNTKTKTKKERSDKLKNRAKVIKATLKNPLKSQREIAKETWVNAATVCRNQKELQQTATKDDRILWICDADLEIIKLWQKIIQDKLNDKKTVKKMKASEVSQVIAENTRRYTLLRWNATDENGWIKKVLVNVSIDE